MTEIFKCPKCLSSDVWRHGFQYENGKKYQKYKCKKCGYVWVKKNEMS